MELTTRPDFSHQDVQAVSSVLETLNGVDASLVQQERILEECLWQVRNLIGQQHDPKQLPLEGKVVSFQVNQWTLSVLLKVGAVLREALVIPAEHYGIANVGEDGVRKFYLTKDGPYGNPIIEVEPDLSIAVPFQRTYISEGTQKELEKEKMERIGGIIVMDEQGNELFRDSLSGRKIFQGKTLELDENGVLDLGADGKYYLLALAQKDKNRFEGYDGVFIPTEYYEKVMVEELVDWARGMVFRHHPR